MDRQWVVLLSVLYDILLSPSSVCLSVCRRHLMMMLDGFSWLEDWCCNYFSCSSRLSNRSACLHAFIQCNVVVVVIDSHQSCIAAYKTSTFNQLLEFQPANRSTCKHYIVIVVVVGYIILWDQGPSAQQWCSVRLLSRSDSAVWERAGINDTDECV